LSVERGVEWLDPLDAAMMTADVLSNPLNVGAVLIMSPPPDAGPGYIDEIHHDALTGRGPVDPRLRRYPYRDVKTIGGWAWREADTVDLSQHCQRISLAPGSVRTGLWSVISQLHAEALDRSRPMWMSYLIDGLGQGRFAFYLKIHHTVLDGVAGVQLIADALSPAAVAAFEQRGVEPVAAARAPGGDDAPGELGLERALRRERTPLRRLAAARVGRGHGGVPGW